MSKICKGRSFPQDRRGVISGYGKAVPKQIMTNDDMAKIVDTSDEWIVTRTGIRQRYVIGEGESSATLALTAAKAAIKNAGFTENDIDLIICATMTPEMVCPSTACFVQQGLENDNAGAFDLNAACSGFTYALSVAASFIAGGQNDHVLVVGVETMSTVMDYTDRSSCIIFGDGAGAVVVSAKENTDEGLAYSAMHADGNYWKTIVCPAYGSRNPASKPLPNKNDKFLQMHGRETYQISIRTIVDMIETTLSDCNLTIDDIAKVIPHQMNARIIDSVVKRMRLPEDKMYVNIDKYANTSAASIPIALGEAVDCGAIKKGDLVLLVAFGAGITWGVNLVKL